MTQRSIQAGIVMTFTPSTFPVPDGQPSVSLPVRTAGIDLGDRISHFCVLDVDGQVLARDRFRTRQDDVRSFAATLAPARVVMEVGTHSPWVSRVFEEAGHEVVVANPRRVKLISEARRKNDRRDAMLLARLGRSDPALLSPIKHRGAEAQRMLVSIRTRSALVRSRTALVLCARNIIKSAGARIGACSSASFPARARNELTSQQREGIEELLTAIAQLNELIKSLDEKLENPPEPYRTVTEHLRQISGVGPVLALTFVLTIDDPNRFSRAREIGAYLGLTPRQNQSGDVDPRLGITRAGDTYLRSLLVGSAHHILHRGPDTDLRRYGQRLMMRDGSGTSPKARKQAAVAVARKLAILLLRLWTTKKDYVPLHAAAAETAP